MILKKRYFASIVLIAVFESCSPSIKSKDPSIRRQAVDFLTDQAILADVALHDPDAEVRLAAVEKVGDQAVLAIIALEEKNVTLRGKAADKVTDQSVLAQVALGEANDYVRGRAICKLTDQAVLAKLAIEGKTHEDRFDATSRLSDEAALTKLAFESGPRIRNVALASLYRRNRALWAKMGNPIAYENALGSLIDADPRLPKIAGRNEEYVSLDAAEAIARMKLATQEQRIKLRLPGLQCMATARLISQDYAGLIDGLRGATLYGEEVHIRFQQSGKELAEETWYSGFPNTITSGHRDARVPVESKSDLVEFVGAKVSGVSLLNELFGQGAFLPEDFYELVHSGIPEVRIAAAAHMDEAWRLKIVMEGEHSDVGESIAQGCVNPATLTSLAKSAPIPLVRTAAIRNERLTDLIVLADLAQNDPNEGVRREAKEKFDRLFMIQLFMRNDERRTQAQSAG